MYLSKPFAKLRIRHLEVGIAPMVPLHESRRQRDYDAFCNRNKSILKRFLEVKETKLKTVSSGVAELSAN